MGNAVSDPLDGIENSPCGCFRCLGICFARRAHVRPSLQRVLQRKAGHDGLAENRLFPQLIAAT